MASQTYSLFERKVWDLFLRPGEVVEVRIPKVWGTSPAWGGETCRIKARGMFRRKRTTKRRKNL